MLDQNTDRMWFVIGAVLIGAAIIFAANLLFDNVIMDAISGFMNGLLDTAETYTDKIPDAATPTINLIKGIF